MSGKILPSSRALLTGDEEKTEGGVGVGGGIVSVAPFLTLPRTTGERGEDNPNNVSAKTGFWSYTGWEMGELGVVVLNWAKF